MYYWLSEKLQTTLRERADALAAMHKKRLSEPRNIFEHVEVDEGFMPEDHVEGLKSMALALLARKLFDLGVELRLLTSSGSAAERHFANGVVKSIRFYFWNSMLLREEDPSQLEEPVFPPDIDVPADFEHQRQRPEWTRDPFGLVEKPQADAPKPWSEAVDGILERFLAAIESADALRQVCGELDFAAAQDRCERARGASKRARVLEV